MIVNLCQSIANPITFYMFSISINNALINVRMLFLEPGSKCRSQIVADSLKIACYGIGAVTFSSNFFVEVGKRDSSWFYRELVSKWVFSWWLIKMPIQA